MDNRNFRRIFALQSFPNGFSLADKHLQILDRKLGNGKRIRYIRDTKDRSKHYFYEEITHGDQTIQRIVSEEEMRAADSLPEVRRNRYEFNFEGEMAVIDVFLGALSGLKVAVFYFDSEREAFDFTKPQFCGNEIKNPQGFFSEYLAEKSFEEVLGN